MTEQWHAHQGLDRPSLVGAFVYSSPWVMPSVRPSQNTQSLANVRKAMNTSKANRWVCVIGALIGVVFVSTLCIQSKTREANNTEFSIGAGMGPDLMTRNGEQNFRQLQQLIDDTIETDEWQLTVSSPMRPYRTTSTVLINGEGCKTFTYDGDGNLLPNVDSHHESTEPTDNPFDSSDR